MLIIVWFEYVCIIWFNVYTIIIWIIIQLYCVYNCEYSIYIFFIYICIGKDV